MAAECAEEGRRIRVVCGRARNAGSRMLCVMVALLRTRVHSVLLKKNSLFLMIGPPIEYPNWLRVNPGFAMSLASLL